MVPTVKLIARTLPVNESFGATVIDFIAYCARVSNLGNQQTFSTSDEFIEYLLRNAHWSPFELAHAVLEITTTRDVSRQILRHRSFSFQEFSQRYGSVKSFSTPREARMQDKNNKQSSDIFLDKELQTEWEIKQIEALEVAKCNYEWALSKGIAKEVAISLLPEGLTMSRLYMSGTIKSWIHYINERSKPNTQKEHKEIAELCKLEIAKIFDTILVQK